MAHELKVFFTFLRIAKKKLTKMKMQQILFKGPQGLKYLLSGPLWKKICGLLLYLVHLALLDNKYLFIKLNFILANKIFSKEFKIVK